MKWINELHHQIVLECYFQISRFRKSELFSIIDKWVTLWLAACEVVTWTWLTFTFCIPVSKLVQNTGSGSVIIMLMIPSFLKKRQIDSRQSSLLRFLHCTVSLYLVLVTETQCQSVTSSFYALMNKKWSRMRETVSMKLWKRHEFQLCFNN